MKTIIVTSDFSSSAHNALAYSCAFLNERENEAELILLNIYTIPAMYTSDGVAVTTISGALSDAEDRLQEEYEWVKGNYPAIRINTRAILGGFLESLKSQVEILAPVLVIMGTSGKYDNMWSWNTEILNVFRDLTVPVLTIPEHLSYTQVRNIAFACNFTNINLHTPVESLKKIIRFTGATLHVIYVKSNAQTRENITPLKQEATVHELLKELAPLYHTLQENDVVEAIGHFVKAQSIDLLLVVPRRVGIWESIFHKSHTKALARFNSTPVLALRER